MTTITVGKLKKLLEDKKDDELLTLYLGTGDMVHTHYTQITEILIPVRREE